MRGLVLSYVTLAIPGIFLGGKEQPVLKADNLTAICQPIVLKMWEPRSLRTPWVSAACYRDSFTFYTCNLGLSVRDIDVNPYFVCRFFNDSHINKTKYSRIFG
jgi:hypothetical protein